MWIHSLRPLEARRSEGRVTAERKLSLLPSPPERKPNELWESDLARKKAVRRYFDFKQQAGLLQSAEFELKQLGHMEKPKDGGGTERSEAALHLEAARLHLEDKRRELFAELLHAEEVCFQLEEVYGVGHEGTIYYALNYEREPNDQ